MRSRIASLIATLSGASSAKLLALVAGLGTGLNSSLAVSASRDNSVGGSVAKGTKAAFAFAVKSGQFVSKMVLASQTTISKAAYSEKSNNFRILRLRIFKTGVLPGVRIVRSRGRGNSHEEGNDQDGFHVDASS